MGRWRPDRTLVVDGENPISVDRAAAYEWRFVSRAPLTPGQSDIEKHSAPSLGFSVMSIAGQTSRTIPGKL